MRGTGRRWRTPSSRTSPRRPGGQPGGPGGRAWRPGQGAPRAASRPARYESGGDPRLGQEQRIRGQRPEPHKRLSPTGVRLRALSPHQAEETPRRPARRIPEDVSMPGIGLGFKVDRLRHPQRRLTPPAHRPRARASRDCPHVSLWAAEVGQAPSGRVPHIGTASPGHGRRRSDFGGPGRHRSSTSSGAVGARPSGIVCVPPTPVRPRSVTGLGHRIRTLLSRPRGRRGWRKSVGPAEPAHQSTAIVPLAVP